MRDTREKIGVLVFPAGEINAMELHDALCSCVNIRLWGASSIERHGSYVFRNYIPGLPMLDDPEFLPELHRLVKEKKIDVIFPTHDTVAEFLTAHQQEITAKVIASDAETARICRDKSLTFAHFSDCAFCPQVFPAPVEFPIFLKPRKGQGGVGSKCLETARDIPPDIDWDNYVLCEYLPGQEYTVDCLTNGSGVLLAALPRARRRVFGGISVSGTSEELTEELRKIAETINGRLHFLGLWYFQVKQDATGKWKLLEVSTRTAGTMCLSRAQGVNLPLLSVYAALGYPLSVIQNPGQVTVDRTLISRYQFEYDYDHVYLDFDDTLLIRGEVYLPTITFLYQCKNKGVPVTLLTRHGMDHDERIQETLLRHCISPGLFDKIVDIAPGEQKSDYIRSGHSILIDNAFAERAAVHERLGIPVFDVDGLEVLRDWRA